MAFGFLNLPKAKWWAALRQVILKNDFKDIETALLEAPGLIHVPKLTWVDATAVKVSYAANSPPAVLMSGWPNILHPGAFISGDITDGKYRVNTADATMDFDVAASLWGTEQVSQWYAILAIAADDDAVFTLKAMPFLRVKSQATQTIKTGTLATPANGINYAFTQDEFVGGVIYFMTGTNVGLMRTITANGVDTDTTITYSGSALTVAAGDWFIVLPPGTNFRLIGDVFNNSSGNLGQFFRLGNTVQRVGTISCTPWAGGGGSTSIEDIRIASPLAVKCNVVVNGGYYEMGHPDIGATAGNNTGQSRGSGTFVSIDFNLVFCRYYCAALEVCANSYEYPPGCGY